VIQDIGAKAIAVDVRPAGRLENGVGLGLVAGRFLGYRA
jgi:hypothetical protein